MEIKYNCNCDLYQARELNVHPFINYFKSKPTIKKYVERFPGYDIYYYETVALSEKKINEKEIITKVDFEKAEELHAENCTYTAFCKIKRKYKMKNKFKGDVLGWGPRKYEWFSICSKHRKSIVTCDLCMIGSYENKWSTFFGHLIYKFAYPIWHWWANQKKTINTKNY